MSAPPYMKLFWGDYHKRTRHLKRDQHGAYFLLIGEAWQLGGALPDDDTKLAAWALCTPEEWSAMKPIIMEFFALRRGKWWHDRVREELATYEATSRKRKEAGKKGGSAKSGKDTGNKQANATQKPVKPEPEPEPIEDKDAPAAPKPKVKKEKVKAPDLELDGGPDVSPARQAYDLYNQVAARIGGTVCTELTESRRTKLNARLNGRGFPIWQEAMEKVERSLFLCGEAPTKRGERPFRLTIEMLLRPDNFQRLLEGVYGDDREPSDPDEPLDADGWSRTRWTRVIEIWRQTGSWPDDAGPEPGQPGCRAPDGDSYDRQ